MVKTIVVCSNSFLMFDNIWHRNPIMEAMLVKGFNQSDFDHLNNEVHEQLVKHLKSPYGLKAVLIKDADGQKA